MTPLTDQEKAFRLAAGAAESPAFVYDEAAMLGAVNCLEPVRAATGCKVLFAVKSCAAAHVLAFLARHVDGFAASSLFEATLARQVMGRRGTVHLTTPGLRPDQTAALAETCDYVTLNSLSQWERFSPLLAQKLECGLRINPQLSFVKDARFDPCRKHSKLGVPMDHLAALLGREPESLSGLRGLHFHTNCDSHDLAPLSRTVRQVDAHLAPLLRRVRWANIGGGYFYNDGDDRQPLHDAVALLRDKYGVQVFIEPGAAIVRDAGWLVSTVLDLFESDGKTVAVLDTTVNHLPEAFDNQDRPQVLGDTPGGRHRYLLAGCTCLAGDVFGEYAFEAPLEVGSRLVFRGVGAYTLVKAHMFNGVNLPAVYAVSANGELTLKKRFTFADFAARCGADENAAV